MKLLYCHDNMYFHSETGEVFSAGQFSYAYFSPLLEIFEDITVAGRGAPLNKNNDIKRLNVSMGEGLDFVLLPNINNIRGRLRHYRETDARLKKLVADADAVIIRAVSDLGWIAFRHARAMKKPIAMEMAACAWDSTWNHGSLLGKVYAPVRFLRDRIIAAHADYIMYVSQTFLQKRYPARKKTARMAIASNVRIDMPHQAQLDRRLALIQNRDDQDIFVIGLIGTLGHKLKGVHTALEALARIEKERPGRFIFRILGPGNTGRFINLAESLELSHCVFFDGTIQSGAKVMEWLEDIDLYIQPSFQEGVPRATIEAMSTACPAIGSTAGGIPELLQPKWLHKPGDHVRLESLIRMMMGDKTLQKEAAIHNFEKSKKYASDKLAPIRKAFWQDFQSFVAQSSQLNNQKCLDAVPDLAAQDLRNAV